MRIWNGGAGWEPLGRTISYTAPGYIWVSSVSFQSIFEGNGHIIANLFVDRESEVGLFGRAGSLSVIRHVGLIDVAVEGRGRVGGLVGNQGGSVIGSYATGTVSGTGEGVGGLVGVNYGSVRASYAAVEVTGGYDVGGLVGENNRVLTASYATGRVAGEDDVGGLVGENHSSLAASYATGQVTSKGNAGGLVGRNGSTVTASYWDTTTSRRTTSSGGLSRTTAALQAPTSYTGIYSQWDVDLDGDSIGDSPWHFGTNAQYPALVVDVDGDGQATWQDFGYQLRAGSTLTATAGATEVALSWTAVDASHWNPAPAVSYTVTREYQDKVETVAEELGSLSFTHAELTPDTVYRYQVSATALGGAATHSAQRVVKTLLPSVTNRPPEAVGALSALRLRVADGPVSVDVAAAFSDPDGDPLSYVAVSSSPSVATVSVSGSVMTVRPLTAGSATVTVTATDTGGSSGTATQSFVVTVPNEAAVAVGTLSDRTLRVSDGSVTVEVSGAFSDPDGDPLTYAAVSSATSVATVSVSASVLTVVPVSSGTATVTVTATDAGGSSGTATQSFLVTVEAETLDYDADDDGLIEITTLAQLDVVRHDMDGDGVPTSSGSSAYAAAFPDAASGQGCPAAGCTGYELATDLDFDTNGSGVADAGDAWWNGGSGWAPIGSREQPFGATFEGNGHTVGGLFISRDEQYLGLFGGTSASSVIRHVGVLGADVSGESRVGGLVGFNQGAIRGSYVAGAVSADGYGGGLVGANREGEITGSYSTAAVAVGQHSGGLVGFTYEGAIRASYATGRVSGTSNVGGLLGTNRGGAVAASYATGRVTGTSGVGGLVGGPENGTVTASYWDTETSGHSTGETGGGSGAATSALQSPTGYAGLYASWDVDADGDGASDRPWSFGTSGEYPVLAVDVDGDGTATWEEFGRQLRWGPVVTAVSGTGEVALSWTAVDASVWTSPPPVTYAMYRTSNGTVERLTSGLGATSYTDTLVSGSVSYQVAAEVWGGESTRSGVVTPATVNRPPQAVRSLSPLLLGVSSGPATVELSGAFSDPDADALTYAAVSSAPGVATVSVSGSVLTVVPVSAGTATVAVTATDADGSSGTATQMFVVTVPNEAPVAVGTLSDWTLRVSDGPLTVDVSGAFSDPDADALTYAAVSSALAVATVSVSGSVVTVTAVSSGSSMVTVTATDAGGSSGTATQTFAVTVSEDDSLVPVGTLPDRTLRGVGRAADGGRLGCVLGPGGRPVDVHGGGVVACGGDGFGVGLGGDGDGGVVGFVDGDGDGDRRGRLVGDGDADVRGDGVERGSGDSGNATGSDAPDRGRVGDGRRLGCVLGPGGRCVDVHGGVFRSRGGDGVGVGLGADGDAGVVGDVDGECDGDRRGRLVGSGDADVRGDSAERGSGCGRDAAGSDAARVGRFCDG